MNMNTALEAAIKEKARERIGSEFDSNPERLFCKLRADVAMSLLENYMSPIKELMRSNEEFIKKIVVELEDLLLVEYMEEISQEILQNYFK